MRLRVLGREGVRVRLRTWWRRIVQDVPADLAACEFDCQDASCDAATFDACPRRDVSVASAKSSTDGPATPSAEATAEATPDDLTRGQLQP